MIIPFFISHSGCPHQCVFCNQINITGYNKSFDISLVPRRIEEYLVFDPGDDPVQVAFYGGSFTALPAEIQTAYLEAVRPFIATGRVKGIRLSTRPDCITTEGIALLKKYHVDTIELGAQSMDDRVLALSERGHTAADTMHAVSLLRKEAFLIGLQLMPGLPGDSTEGFMKTVEKTISLKPDFVRIYPALVIKGTPLAELYRIRRYSPLSLDEAVALCKRALLNFEETGVEVIRMGLQPTEELEKPGTIIAGPYHPAFRQLVESAILLDKMEALLTNEIPLCRDATFLVHPLDLSVAIGQKRTNLLQLKNQFGLNTIRVHPNKSIHRRTVTLIGGEQGPSALERTLHR
jgi:histone acetyltransferase (RNA polymerase elongator complex component)